MRTTEILRSVMKLAWQFVKRNGYTMSEALKVAWANIKLKARMKSEIAKFYYRKVDSLIREAYGTLSEKIRPSTGEANRKSNDTIQVYYDTERQEYRSFKKANLVIL